MKRWVAIALLVGVIAVARAEEQGGAPSAAQELKPRPVSREGVEYLQRLRKNTPFGTKSFDLKVLRAGMGTRRTPTVSGVKLIRTKVGEIPCEWVLAPGADPDLRLLYIHGGGFVSGSGGFYLPLASHISAAARCAVLLPDYRLAPEHPFPAGLDDCVAAHEWMTANGPSGRALARATFVAGDSAGGSLTLATLLALRDRRMRMPAGGIPLSATTDLTLASESLKTASDPIISAKTMPIFRDHYIGKGDPRHPLASPVFGDYRGLPPLLIQVGEHEMLHDDSIRVAKKARADGLQVQLEDYRGMFHVFQSHDPLLPEAREAVDHIAQFMHALVPAAPAGDFIASEHERRMIYRSPQKPGFTSWCGAWTMPDGSLMVSFTQATGPVEGRPRAPKEVQEKLNWPPPGQPGYDMTGLELRNVHLRSTDAGKTWPQVSADAFKSCMNGVSGEAETALADGTVLRGVFGFYLPYDADAPRTGFLQRSSDGTKTWGKPEVPLDPKKYTAWPRRIRTLRDGRLVALLGVAPLPAGSHTREELSKRVQPMLVVSSDKGKSWLGPIAAVPQEQPDGWTEEFDVAELASGDLLAVYRRASDAKRWQATLRKSGDGWIVGKIGPSPLPHSGQPELLATREGPILHVATTGIHWTSDGGNSWHKLDLPGSPYYPRAVQAADGRIFIFGHVGGDDAYGKVDQSIVMDAFRLNRRDIEIANRSTLSAEKIVCERIPLGEADDYKPCVAQLPNGELLLTAFHQHPRDGKKVLEQTLLFRSLDGGRTWSPPEKLSLLGREPYLTVLKDGTLFITGHLLANDVRNTWGYTTGFLHRSTDGGRTWQSLRVESEAIKPKASNHTSRNVLELADGTLLLGVDYDGGGGPYFVWRSTDGGKNWDKSQRCEPRDFKSIYGFFGGETWLWQARGGKIWALTRVDSNELPIKDRPIKAGNDQADHFILFSSGDGGKTFDRIRDFGDYGEMYMSLLRLRDRRLLLTFTVRDLRPPLGVRALLGLDTDDGFAFDFAHDRLLLDARTPVGASQGGGFGPTVQLADETLVTSYSYRDSDGKTHLEVVRWRAPQPNAKP